MFDGAKPKGLRHTDLVRGSAGKASPGFLGLLHLTDQQAELVAILTTVQLPIPWESFGLPPALQTRSTCLIDGPPAWAWDEAGPELGIPFIEEVHGEEAPGWDLDHVVILVPDLDATAQQLVATIGAPRLRTVVKDRPTAFYRVGPLLEVIQSPVRAPALFGIALVTTDSLEVTVLNWRSRGLDVSRPRPALQAGRRIFTVRGTEAGLAVMSPDGPILSTKKISG